MDKSLTSNVKCVLMEDVYIVKAINFFQLQIWTLGGFFNALFVERNLRIRTDKSNVDFHFQYLYLR